MDFDDTPEEAAFRAEARAFLNANATRKQRNSGAHRYGDTDAAEISMPRPGRRRKRMPDLPASPGRRNGAAAAVRRCSRSSGTRRRRNMKSRTMSSYRPGDVHPHHDRLCSAGTVKALRASRAARRGNLVPALFRTRRRFGRRRPAHPRGKARRRVGDQRPEDLDLRCALFRLRPAADAQRSERAETRRADRVLHRHARTGRGSKADPSDVRRVELQRSVLHSFPSKFSS